MRSTSTAAFGRSLQPCQNRVPLRRSLSRKEAPMTKLFVAIRNDRSIHHLLSALNRDRTNPPVLPLGDPGDNDYVLIRCTSAETTGFGFLRLVPDPEANTPADLPVAVTIPVQLMAWMVETPDSSATHPPIL